MSETDYKPPYILEPQDAAAGRPATFIFLHGYGDDAEGLPLGLAQQFQWHNKLPYLRWVLPNAPFNRDAFARAWYVPKALPNGAKPRVPGHEHDDDKEDAEGTDRGGGGGKGDDTDDEKGILQACDVIDSLVRYEIEERGVEPGRVIVGGFSQGCAVSLVWGLVGKERKNVGGVFCASGYFPLARRIQGIKEERGLEKRNAGGDEAVKEENLKWLYVHGSRDVLVPTRLFEQGKTELGKWVAEDDVVTKLYDGMGHSTCNAELRDLLFWLGRMISA